MKTTPSVVLLSGGMDSATALAREVKEGDVRLAVSVDYGQRHVRELDSAVGLARYYGVDHEVLDLTGWGRLLKGSSLTDPDVEVPEGHYAAPSMAATVVPNRNATMLMAAAGVAQAVGAQRVVTAVHAGDHAVYPDCRPEFIQAASLASTLGAGVEISAPFVHITKTDIARLGGEIGVPFEITWSCYKGGIFHCGKCGTCYERREAFEEAGLEDPTAYEEDAA
jgi:7-cyano-7-deazaguanine synthase